MKEVFLETEAYHTEGAMTDDIEQKVKDQGFFEAARMVAILTDENEQLRQALKLGTVSEQNQRMFEFIAEIERLREVLRNICDGQRDANKSYAELFAEVKSEARDALEVKY